MPDGPRRNGESGEWSIEDSGRYGESCPAFHDSRRAYPRRSGAGCHSVPSAISRLIKNGSSRIANGCFRRTAGSLCSAPPARRTRCQLEERSTLLDELVAAGIDPSRMMVGTGCCSITETVTLTAQAVKHGCAGVLMLPPFYYKGVSEEGLYRYFSEVVQRVGDARLRIYLYHIPPVAMVGITPGLVERLLKSYPHAIAGMKDSSGDWNNTKMFLDAFAPSGFDVFAGSESFLLANMRNGGAGTISATANVNPAAIHQLYAEWKNADADEQQAKLNVVRDAFGQEIPDD